MLTNSVYINRYVCGLERLCTSRVTVWAIIWQFITLPLRLHLMILIMTDLGLETPAILRPYDYRHLRNLMPQFTHFHLQI